MKKLSSRNGFTIVELIMVVVVIAILATISVVAFGAWRERVAKTEVISDLRNAALAMNNFRNFNDVFPTTIPDSFKPSPNVTITPGALSAASFCIQAVSKAKPTIIYSTNSTTKKDPTAGTCP